MSLKSFTDAYITAALWSSCDDDGAPLDRDHGPEDLSPETKAQMEQDCERFYTRWSEFWDGEMVYAKPWSEDEQAGHDFWLTRQGHGAGFWDGDWHKPVGDALTTACKNFPEVYLWVQDGVIYHG